MTATLRLRLRVSGERPKDKPSLDRKVEVSAVFVLWVGRPSIAATLLTVAPQARS